MLVLAAGPADISAVMRRQKFYQLTGVAQQQLAAEATTQQQNSHSRNPSPRRPVAANAIFTLGDDKVEQQRQQQASLQQYLLQEQEGIEMSGMQNGSHAMHPIASRATYPAAAPDIEPGKTSHEL